MIKPRVGAAARKSGKRRKTGTRRAGPGAPATAAPKPARPRSPDVETEQRILEAARRVFMRRGTAGARMQEIAREAGVNQALLHYYFRTKERLSAAVFQDFASRLFPALIQVLASDAPLEDKVERIVRLYLENLSRQPFLPGYVLSELHHHPERIEQVLGGVAGARPDAVMRPLIDKLQRDIDARVAAGTLRQIGAEQLIANLISLSIFPFAARPMLSLILRLDDAGFEAFIEQRKRDVPGFVLRGLRP